MWPPLGPGKGWCPPPPRKCSPAGGGGGGRCSARVETDSDPARRAAAPLLARAELSYFLYPELRI